MDVTRRNFHQILPDLKKAVLDAEFIAIDLEFTGLSSGGRDLDEKPFDTPRQYYEKLYQKALEFLPLQVGVCIFQYNVEKAKFTYEAFNFYVFPFSNLKGFPNSIFKCQSSSMAFLSSCDFDFNKAFKEGISFLTQSEEDQLRATIEERQQKKESNNAKEATDIPIPDHLKETVEVNMEKIKNFLDDESDEKEQTLTLNRCNAFLRRILYQEVPKKFGDSVLLETDESSFAMKVLKGGGEEARSKRQEQRKEWEWQQFDEAVGFSLFIKILSESGKLIVGHNSLLDICHLVNRFRYPLPAKYEDFKELVHHIFPRIIDTKFMTTASHFKDVISNNYLPDLLETVSKAPFEMPILDCGNGHSYCKSPEKLHEGGYDAYITGKCFLSMCHYLANQEGKALCQLDSIKDLLKQYENRLYLMRVQDVPYLRLGAQDDKPPRNHVFHLMFPREWRQFDIVDLFKPFGSIFISFIDEKSAFVALHKKDQAKFVLKNLSGSSKLFKITSFSAFQKQADSSKCLPTSNFHSPSFDVRKRKLGEPTEGVESPAIFKKQCGSEQSTPCQRQSFDPIPEETETETTGVESTSPSSLDQQKKSAKEFPESETWG